MGSAQENVPDFSQKAKEGIKNRYIVVFNDEWPGIKKVQKKKEVQPFRTQFLRDANIPKDSVIAEYDLAIQGFTARMNPQKAEALSNNPKINYVEQDQTISLSSTISTTSNGSSKNRSTITTTSSRVIPWGVERVGGPADGTGKKAWIIDTGIDLDHPDLNVDVTNSISFVPGESADDLNGHSTFVAGVLAAKNNEIDVVGVAAGATVASAKACDKLGDCDYSQMISAIDHIVNNGSNNQIINISITGAPSTSIDNAIKNAGDNYGFRFVIAAGNFASDANNFSPARIEHFNTYTISAFREGDKFVQTFDPSIPNCNPFSEPNKGSNFGNPPVGFSGPGENIYSLWKNSGTLTTCGTSFAAPHVAGIILINGTISSIIPTDGMINNDQDGTPDKIARLPSDLDAYISGPSFVSEGQQGTWNVNVAGGFPPFEHDWQRNKLEPPHWEYLNHTDESYSETVTEYFELKVKVTDATNTVIETPVFTISSGSSSF